MYTSFKKSILFSGACYLLLSGSACTKTKVFEIESAPLLVVNAVVAPDSAVAVGVTASKTPQEGFLFRPVENARVTLTSENNHWLLDRFTPPGVLNDVGVYIAKDKIFVKPGSSYTLRIAADGYTAVEAFTKIPLLPRIENIRTTEIAISPLTPSPTRVGYSLAANLKFRIDDPGEEKNYYLIRLTYQSDYLLPNTLPVRLIDSASVKTISFSLENIESTISPLTLRGGVVLTDKDFKTEKNEISIRVRSVLELKNTAPTSMTMEIWSLNRDFYEYIESNNRQYASGNDPFAEPANAYSNISGGLGIFCAYSRIRQVVNF
jgi:Domain of unknown function (DUF4249)